MNPLNNYGLLLAISLTLAVPAIAENSPTTKPATTQSVVSDATKGLGLVLSLPADWTVDEVEQPWHWIRSFCVFAPVDQVVNGFIPSLTIMRLDRKHEKGDFAAYVRRRTPVNAGEADPPSISTYHHLVDSKTLKIGEREMVIIRRDPKPNQSYGKDSTTEILFHSDTAFFRICLSYAPGEHARYEQFITTLATSVQLLPSDK